MDAAPSAAADLPRAVKWKDFVRKGNDVTPRLDVARRDKESRCWFAPRRAHDGRELLPLPVDARPLCACLATRSGIPKSGLPGA